MPRASGQRAAHRAFFTWLYFPTGSGGPRRRQKSGEEMPPEGYSHGMVSQLQITANLKNAQKSTGPRSVEGKAVSRFNALKSGIHAKSQVIPGEDPAELEALAQEYREEFTPKSPSEMVLVDSLIAGDWQLRRLRKVEALLWREFADTTAAADLLEAYGRNKALDQVQRRIQTTERSYRQTLKQIREIQKEDQEAREKEASRKKDQETIAWARAEARPQVRAGAAGQVRAEMGSFYPDEKDAGYLPYPEDASQVGR
jgi:hypothetical protein